MDVIGDILRREGGFVDHPADRGGPTNMGITLPTLSTWLRRPATLAELKALTRDQAARIYTDLYITAPGFDRLPSDDRLLAVVVDAAVNHGTKQAIKILQNALGVTADGILGPLTRQALFQADYGKLCSRFVAERARFYGRLITNNPDQSVFAAGWMNRVAEFVERLS